MNQKLKILIVEDSPSFAIELESLVLKIGYDILANVDTAEEALVEVTKEIPDLILLDIQLKGKLTGVDLSTKLTHLEIPVIFITSSLDESYYLEAKKSKILAYLSKPMSSFSLRISIETAINNAFNISENKESDFLRENFLFIKKNDVYEKIHISTITYLHSSDNYCEIYTKNNDAFLLRATISKIIGELLPKEKFVRIHRQYIVHLNHINKISIAKNSIEVNLVNLPLGKTYKKEFLKVMETLR